MRVGSFTGFIFHYAIFPLNLNQNGLYKDFHFLFTRFIIILGATDILMSSIPRIRGGLANVQREVSKHVNAASLPDVIHKPDEEARNIHPRDETLVTCLEDAYDIAAGRSENDANIANDNITGERSSHSFTIQAQPKASTSSTQDMKEAQEPSGQSSTDGAQSTAQRVSITCTTRPKSQNISSF